MRNHNPHKLALAASHTDDGPPPTKMTRVSVDLTAYQLSLLEALMKRTGMSKAAVLRFGLNILCDAAADKDEGFVFGAWKGNKERRYNSL